MYILDTSFYPTPSSKEAHHAVPPPSSQTVALSIFFPQPGPMLKITLQQPHPPSFPLLSSSSNSSLFQPNSSLNLMTSVQSAPLRDLGYPKELPTHSVDEVRESQPRVIIRDLTVAPSEPSSSPSLSTNDSPQDDSKEIRIVRINTKHRGRILIADTGIPKGTLIMRTMPQAAILTGDGRVQRCAHCLLLPQVQTTQTSDKNEQRNGPFTGCRQGCNMVFYCNDHFKGPQGIARNCPQRDWDLFHQYECGFLKLLHYVTDLSATQIQDPTLVSIYEQLEQHHREAIVNYRTKDEFEQDYCRVLMRILSLRFREMVSKEELCTVYAGQQISSTDQDLVFRPEPFASMMTLTENRESYPSEKLKGDMVDVAKILDAYQGYLHLWYQQQQSQGQGSGAGASLSRLSPDDLLGLVCREECNSFGLYAYPPGGDHKEYLTSRRDISTNAKVGYGLGLFRFASSFNHSCSPNLYHVAYGPQFLVYAARDIEPKEELNIFYLEPGPTYRLDRLAGPHVTISDPSRLGPEQEMDQRKAALQSRRAYLEEIFHFSCTCTRCHWEESQIQTLNARILRQDGNNALQQYEPEDEKETFLRLGLLCNRSGCYGFFAPPVVANVLIEQRGWNSLFMDPNKWVCVACGALQH